MSKAKKLFAKALQVDDGVHAPSVDAIVRSEPLSEAAWTAEIEGRARRALSGESAGIDADAAMDSISLDLGL